MLRLPFRRLGVFGPVPCGQDALLPAEPWGQWATQPNPIPQLGAPKTLVPRREPSSAWCLPLTLAL